MARQRRLLKAKTLWAVLLPDGGKTKVYDNKRAANAMAAATGGTLWKARPSWVRQSIDRKLLERGRASE